MAEAKKAIQRIVTDESGNIRIIYVDLETLKTVPDPSNYQVVNANQQNIEQVVNINDPDPVPLNPTSITDKLGRQTPLEQSRELLGEGGRGGQEGVRSVGGNNPTSPVDTSVRSPETLGAPVGTVERSSLGNSVGGRQRETSSNSVGVTTSENSRRNTDNPTGRTTAGFINDFSKAEHRKGDVSQDFQRSVTDAVANTRGLGPQYDVQGYSGFGQYGSHRHRDEDRVAMDFNVKDQTGKQITDDRMKDLAGQYAFDNPTAGIGYGQGYMGKGSMHLDLSGAGGNWGKGGKGVNMDPALRETIDAARAGNLPTPFDNPGMPYSRDEQAPSGYTAPAATGDYIDTNTVGGLSAGSIAAMEAQRSGIGATVTGGKGFTTIDNGYTSTTRSGDRSARNNNPGNLEMGPRAERFGAIGDDGRFAVFDDPKQGLAAMQDLLFSANINKTIEQAITSYAPPNENNTKGYISNITTALGLPADTRLSDLSMNQRDTMMNAMIDTEGKKGYSETSSMHTYSGPPGTGNMNSPSESISMADRQGFGDGTSKGSGKTSSFGGGYDLDAGRFGDMTGAVGRANGESQGGRGRGGYAAGGNSTPAEGLGQESSGGRGRGGYAAGGNSNTSAGGRSSGAADKDTSSYGGAKDSGDAQSSGRSGGSSTSSGGKSGGGGGGGRAGGVGTAGVGGGFASVDKDKDTPGGRTSGKTDDN